MSWGGTYTHTVAVAVDILTASVIWNRYGVTVSSRCGWALRRPRPGIGQAVLRALGRGLNAIDPGHCEGAIAADLARGRAAVAWLKEGQT